MVLAISAAEPENVLGGGCVESVLTSRTHLRFGVRRVVEVDGMIRLSSPPFEIAMLEIHTRLRRGCERCEGHFDGAGFARIGYRFATRTDVPREHEPPWWFPGQHAAPITSESMWPELVTAPAVLQIEADVL